MIENGHDDTIGQCPSPQYDRRFAVHNGVGGDFADGENQRVDGRGSSSVSSARAATDRRLGPGS